MGRKAVGFIMEGRDTWPDELQDPPLLDLLNYTAHFLEDKFGQPNVFGLKRNICVILPRQLNDLFWRDTSYLILSME